MGLLAYFSSSTNNTHHFVTRLNQSLFRIEKSNPEAWIDAPYVLVVPTYAGDDGRGAVPKAVMRFLNDKHNRELIRGVITGGNRNFGWAYGLAGDVIAEKCKVPCLYKFELRGTDDDVMIVKQGLEEFWKRQQ